MTHTFNLDRGSIRLVVSHNGKKYRKATGATINPNLWNQKAKSLRAKCKSERAYEKLYAISLRLDEKAKGVSTEQDVLDAIAYALTGEEKKKGAAYRKDRPSFWDFFKGWSEVDVPSKKDRNLAYRRLSDIMGTADDWEDIDTAYYSRLVASLNALGYSENYKATLIAKLKTVLIEGEKMKYHTNREYKKFAYKWETADTIALSQDEVDAIWGAELSGPKARARDAFIVGVYTAARFSDYSRISKDNIQGGKLTLQFKQRKTQGEVIIPVSPRVLAVLNRNGGRVPKISEQEVGRYMKQICKGLGGTFDDVVQISKSKGAYHTIEKKHRWELVSTHTARRTGATLLYLHYKVPAYLCCKMTGHKDLKTFLSYVKASSEESVRILADNPFFK